MRSTEQNKEWLTLPFNDNVQLQQLLSELSRNVEQKKNSKATFIEETAYIDRFTLRLPNIGNSNSQELILLLRQLCKLYEPQPISQEITSHRKIVGPLIVLSKKILLPFMNKLFSSFFQTQKEFNAVVIAILFELVKKAPENR
jgi:hypothetical protein